MSDDRRSDFLSGREAEFMQAVMDELGVALWVAPLLAKIDERGGLTRAAKPFLFELRFGHALHRVGIEPAYEIKGENESNLDFGFTAGGHDWRVELMRLEETEAVKRATKSAINADGIQWTETVLSTSNADKRESEEGETLKAVERLCQKCERDGRPHKFTTPDGSSINVLLVDMRLFGLGASDHYDYALIALGCDAVPDFCKRTYDGRPISGAFETSNELRGAEHLRERVHFIGFVRERAYGEGEFAKSIAFVGNEALFESRQAAQAVIDAWPLQATTLLNGVRRSDG